MAREARKREQARAQRFAERYQQRGGAAGRAIELAVIGYNGGANGYTTLRQADGLVRALRLGRDSRLLDIGCGQGWPSVMDEMPGRGWPGVAGKRRVGDAQELAAREAQ